MDKKASNKNLDLELNDEVHSAEALEAKLEAALSPTEREAINQTVNAIPRFVKEAAQPALNAKVIEHHLQAAKRALAQTETRPNLAASPATSVPLLGRLWGTIRGQMHDLVLFYVNRLGGTTSRVDGQLIEAVAELTALVEQQQAEIERLKEERVKDKG